MGVSPKVDKGAHTGDAVSLVLSEAGEGERGRTPFI
jgi:hypothetical protein